MTAARANGFACRRRWPAPATGAIDACERTVVLSRRAAGGSLPAPARRRLTQTRRRWRCYSRRRTRSSTEGVERSVLQSPGPSPARGSRLPRRGAHWRPSRRWPSRSRGAGGAAQASSVDASDERAVADHLDAIAGSGGRIDVSFNATGIGWDLGAPVVDMPLDDFVVPIAAGMRTHVVTATAAARRMIGQRSGVILAITATPARQPIPLVGNFGVGCAAIEALCRQLALELGPYGIRVVCMRSAGSPELARCRRRQRLSRSRRPGSPTRHSTCRSREHAAEATADAG